MRRANEHFYAHHPAEDTFRTSMAAAPLMARAMVHLLEHVDEALGHPDVLDVIDIGCGDGALLRALLELSDTTHLAKEQDRRLPPLRLHGIDLRPRPPGLDHRIAWTQGSAPEQVPHGLSGMVIAHEWLDDLPVDVLEASPTDGMTVLMIDPSDRREHRIPAAHDGDALLWAQRWWPSDVRAETGHVRDAAWADVASRIDRGLLVCVDYGHRSPRRPSESTLRGFVDGKVMAPVPDGSMNITADVALDACATAARTALVSQHRTGQDVITTQANALDLLLPLRERTSLDPADALHVLAEHGQRSELVDPFGLGAHLWLLQSVNIPLPDGWT
jgi:SAM-dependent MidA family methyltransferase